MSNNSDLTSIDEQIDGLQRAIEHFDNRATQARAAIQNLVNERATAPIETSTPAIFVERHDDGSYSLFSGGGTHLAGPLCAEWEIYTGLKLDRNTRQRCRIIIEPMAEATHLYRVNPVESAIGVLGGAGAAQPRQDEVEPSPPEPEYADGHIEELHKRVSALEAFVVR